MLRVLASALLLLLLTGCSLFSGEDNATPPAELVELKSAIKIKQIWEHSLAGSGELRSALRPLYWEGRIYVADPKGQVLSLDAATGKELWSTDTDAPLSGGPGMADDLVLVGSNEAELIALDRETGEQRWRRTLNSEILSTPSGEAGLAVARSADGRVTAVKTAVNEIRWEVDREVPVLTLRGTSSPLVKDGRVYVGFANGKLVCLNLASGDLLWETTVVTPQGRTEIERVVDLDTDLVDVEGVIYVGSFQGGLSAVSASSGVVLWHNKVSTYAGLDADWREVFVTDNDSNVWGLDATNGATLWEQKELHNRALSAPAIDGDRVVVGDYEGYVHWLAQDDGRVLGRIKVGGSPIQVKPLVVDDIVYIYDSSGQLSALRAKRLDEDDRDSFFRGSGSGDDLLKF